MIASGELVAQAKLATGKQQVAQRVHVWSGRRCIQQAQRMPFTAHCSVGVSEP